MTFKAAQAEAFKNSLDGYSQHVNKSKDGEFYVSDWFNCDSTRATYEDGRRIY